ncbi:TetR/AcrR family transcriptional regulator [Streptomyces sp. CBMA156]|uniref:TetR/AcrR family transcriptional regulator n=1 Tax=Streptomyces sp. CBMA156 TaxID=1930280 RepID=UPI001661D795|nr:TetR/AcrR family transcriptional regulator [Streptomyces sp. CBMA156]MBD0674186.1 TetR family transcriptional regulator [Streptomyces sp. CBMA156]
MARTSAGHETRERLVRAAEELFATRGVEAALTRDIIRLAGQSNPSAVQYHFGSREGLLDAIMAGRQERTERALAPHLPALADADLPGLLDALVAAEATELRTEQGRHCLRISAQVSHNSGVRTRSPHPTLAGGGYWHLIERVEERISALPEPIRLERIDLVLTLIGAALADRAQQYLAGSTPLTDEETFLADLVTMSAAMLSSPTPRRSRS